MLSERMHQCILLCVADIIFRVAKQGDSRKMGFPCFATGQTKAALNNLERQRQDTARIRL